MERKIGVLGASGVVGQAVVNELIRKKVTGIIVGCRNIEKLQEFEGMEKRKVDINNTEELKDFCSQCSVVINCAGVFTPDAGSIARVCLETNTHYVDVSGDEKVVDCLMEMNGQFREKNLYGIHSAGVKPGLVEILAYEEAIHNQSGEIKVFFSGNGEMSINAALDMVRSTKSENNYGMSYVHKGKIEKINEFMGKQYLPEPVGEVMCFPIIDQMFLESMRSAGITSAYFYNALKNESILTCLVTAKMDASREERKIAEELVEVFHKESMKSDKKFTAIYIDIMNNLEKKKKAMHFNGDWNELTGIVAATIGYGILQGITKNCGTGGFWSMGDCQWLLTELRANSKIEIKTF